MNVRVEDELQTAGYQYLAAVLPDDAYAYGVDKAGKRTVQQAAALLRRGIKSGMPDGPLIWRGIAFMIEYKTDTGSLTPSQRVEFPLLERAGVQIAICQSVVDVDNTIRRWGIGPLRHTSLTPEFRDMAWRARVAKKRLRAKATAALTAQADAEAGVTGPKIKRQAKPRFKPGRAAVARGIRLSLVGIK
jgi:hypothetical protein